MNSPIASPLDRAMELARQYAHAYHNHYTNGSTSIEGGLLGCENRLRAALAQLGTGSGAGAQSDSGADSGHFARAVQSEGSTAREDAKLLEWIANQHHVTISRYAEHFEVRAQGEKMVMVSGYLNVRAALGAAQHELLRAIHAKDKP